MLNCSINWWGLIIIHLWRMGAMRNGRKNKRGEVCTGDDGDEAVEYIGHTVSLSTVTCL